MDDKNQRSASIFTKHFEHCFEKKNVFMKLRVDIQPLGFMHEMPAIA